MGNPSQRFLARSGPRGAARPAAATVASALLGVVLLALLPPGSGHRAAGGDGGEASRDSGPEQAEISAATSPRLPAQLGGAAAREQCADGRDPAETLTPSRDAGPAVRRIQERGELIVGVDQTSYLWGFRDPDTHEIVGFDIDLVEAIAEDLLGPSPRVVYRAVPTSERTRLIREREIDMVVRSMSITCERQEEVAFSSAYFDTGQQLLAPHSSSVEGFDASLEGQRVCSAGGSTAQILLQERGTALGAELVTVGDHLDCLVLIQLGEADALMSDGALAAGHAAQDPAVRLVGEALTHESYGVAMHLEDEDLVRRVNSVLAGYTSGGADSRWARSYRQWLADHMETTAVSPPEPMYRD